MDRRAFVKRLSAGMGAALSPGVLAAILSGCDVESEATDLLAASEADILGSLTDAIIPRTDTPGARDAGVPAYVETMLEHFTPSDQVETFRSQLDWISSWLADQDASGLEDVDDEKLNALLTALDEQAFGAGSSHDLPPGAPALFAQLKPLTVAGYYTSELGATEELHTMPFREFEDVPFDEIGKTFA